MRFFFSLALAALAAHGGVLFEDDFDSYPDGYDLGDSTDWEYFSGEGITVSDGSATTGADNDALIMAVGAVEGEDYAVSCEFSGLTEEDGGEILLGLRAGLDRGGELYYVDIYPDGETYCLDLVYELNGNPEVLTGTCLQADQDGWHSIALSASGSGPVEFEVCFDGDSILLHTEETYIAPAGVPAFGFSSGDSGPLVDGFVQTDGGASVVGVSFGWIKARF